jgi:branched-chain amino acid transport system substrate-binding protein
MNASRHTPLAMRLGQIQADGSIRILATQEAVSPGIQCPNLQ